MNAKLIETILHQDIHWAGYNKWVLGEIRAWEKSKNYKISQLAAREFLEKKLIPKSVKIMDATIATIK